ncbi:SNX11 protein, partial [Atractosteus spatula]|nr:SNX11 protein [Atractosteus spatula]
MPDPSPLALRSAVSPVQEFIAVRVQDPKIQNEGSWNSYVDFKIFLHTNSKAFTAKTSCVRRRYSEFVWLKKKLQKNAGLVPVPELPVKTPFFTLGDEDFIEKRRQGLQHFLDRPQTSVNQSCALARRVSSSGVLGSFVSGQVQGAVQPVLMEMDGERRQPPPPPPSRSVLHMTVFLSDSQLHLFLQTQLAPADIEACVQGHTHYTVTDAILGYASSNQGWAQEEEGRTQEPGLLSVPYEWAGSPTPVVPAAQCESSSEGGTPADDAPSRAEGRD